MAKKSESQKKLTTVAGAPVVDNQNTMTAGPRGPALLQDVWFLEKLGHFDREVIPERRMHAKGSGAFGTFKVTKDVPAPAEAAPVVREAKAATPVVADGPNVNAILAAWGDDADD